MPERRLSVPVAALAAALPLAVGCSSNGAATGTPPPLVSTSASSLPSSPTVTPTVTPTATTAVNTDAAVLAAAQRYADALTRTGATADLSAYEAITTPNCPCRGDEATVARTLRQKHAHTTAVFTLINIKLQARTAGNAVVLATLVNAPFDVVDAQGKLIKHVAANQDPRRLDLVLVQNRWLIDSVEGQ